MGALGNLGPGLLAQETGSLASTFTSWIVQSNQPPAVAPTTNGPFRPPNWGVLPQLYLLTVTLPASQTAAQGSGQPAQPTNYYFDAVFRAEHNEEWRYTQHPVQNGAAISDHVYHMPSKVTLEIGISDLMDSFVSGQYSGGSSKSVTAYQKFVDIANLRIPIKLSTRLFSYDNMIIANIRVNDTRETRWALRAWITFAQIIPAKVSITTNNVLAQQITNLPSARLQDTNFTDLGTKTTQAPGQALTDATQVTPPVAGSPNFLTDDVRYTQGSAVPGAGSFSSYAPGFATGGQ
jgi:hypothetical protein